ncbi:MAG: ferredoxin [Chloroflexi bacterium]|nr:ferredoxin [Chloroflexota bacterium]
MSARDRVVGVSIDAGACWGRYVSEDSEIGACQVCVELCPAVFEKPVANECARVRPHARYENQAGLIALAAGRCPMNGIRVYWARSRRSRGHREVTRAWLSKS